MSKIKICGLTRIEDIETVNKCLPDYIGFVFAPSKRNVDIDTAFMLRNKLNSKINAIGVFVNSPIEFISNIIEKNIIDIVQLHGNENEDYIASLKGNHNIPIIKAISVKTQLDILQAQNSAADYLLFDNGSGGTGKCFNWELLNNLILQNKISKPFFIAGGININNINQALTLNPYAIDVSGGVETNGVKDSKKIKLIIEKVHQNL